jgi:hypothetical protein
LLKKGGKLVNCQPVESLSKKGGGAKAKDEEIKSLRK